MSSDSLIFSHHNDQKKREKKFQPKNRPFYLFFYPKYLENILVNLINSFITSKNHLKNWNKKTYQLKFVFLDNFKVMVRIDNNKNFL